MTTNIAKSVEKFISTCEAIREAVEAAGPRGIPNGYIYAAIMEHVTFEEYSRAIRVLIESGRIKDEFDLLTAVKTAE